MHFVCVAFWFSEGSFVFMVRQVCAPSVLNVQTHGHLPKLKDSVRNGKKCFILRKTGKYFSSTVLFVSVHTIFISVFWKCQFHCFLSCLIFSCQCSYALFQASDQARHMGIAWGFLTKNPENLTSTIGPTKRKFTKFKVIRKSGWAPHATKVAWVMVWWSLCKLCNAIGIHSPFSLFSPFNLLCKLRTGNFSGRSKYVKWSSWGFFAWSASQFISANKIFL